MNAQTMLNKIIFLAGNNADIEVVWLYGSYAKQTAHSESDYDLAIAFKSYIKDPLDARLRPETLALDWASQLKVPAKFISIIDINLAPLSLTWEVVHYGKAIYVVNEFRQIREEMRIARMYEIDLLFSRKKHAR